VAQVLPCYKVLHNLELQLNANWKIKLFAGLPIFSLASWRAVVFIW
jgi:hypothetical protein